MKLSDWTQTTGIKPTYPTTERGATSILLPISTPRTHRIDLWHLSDYRVSSVSGPVVWMTPVPPGAFPVRAGESGP